MKTCGPMSPTASGARPDRAGRRASSVEQFELVDDAVEPLFVVLVTVDWQNATTTLVRSDGKSATMPVGVPPQRDISRVKRLQWVPRLDVLIAETTLGDEVAFEMPRFDETDHLAGRLVVYLDQNMWSMVAHARHDPSRVPNADDVPAALQLASWVEERRIILPLSSGHHSETTKWGDERSRYRLGLTELQLSRGWQMRDPLAVRRHEIRSRLIERSKPVSDKEESPVFTLQPNAASSRSVPSTAPADTSPAEVHALQSLTYASTMIAVMLDPEQIPPTTAALGWVAVNQRFSNWLDSETRRTADQKRKSVDVLFMRDMGAEIAEEAYKAGLTPEELAHWLSSPFLDIRDMPALGLYREMLQQRHLNVGTTWRPNDLTDIVYLSCAMGHADVVIAERHMAAIGSQSLRQLGRRTSVLPSLREAIPIIEARICR